MTRSRRLAAVDTFVFPAGVRFALSDLDAAQIAAAETAARQWFRLAARHPKTTMSMPSAVDRLWQALSRHEREYREFTTAVVGRDFPYSAATGALAATYRFARADEPGGMPLLFRIDKQLGVTGGRHYIEDCGGRGECFPVRGATCLQHLTGVGRATKWGFTKSSEVPPGVVCGGL
jgi:hypothetical protein